MNKGLIIKRFSKASNSYDKDADAQRKIAVRMINLLQPHVQNEVKRAVEIGCGTGIFSRLLIHAFKPQFLTINDICEEMKCRCADILTHANYSFVDCDAEQWELPQQIDLLTSCSAFQWFNHPGHFFGKAYSALNTGGTFAFSTFGKENMLEISRLTGNSLSYFTSDELSQMLLKSGFSIVYSEEEKITLTFNTPKDVLLHMKRTGVNGISAKAWTKSALLRFTEQYLKEFGTPNGQVPLTYHPIYFVCKKL